MKVKLLIPLFLCTLSFLYLSCGKKGKIDAEFFIPVEKSKLYVRMVGNADKPLLINLHGGPGAFSGFDHEFNRKYLEDDYLIAYLDQRGGGKSDAVTDTTMLTMAQLVKDLDVVVDSLKQKYKGKKVNLIGGSWGGTLGLLYLIGHQEKINSFACVSGKADGLYPIFAIIGHERKLAKALLEKSDDPKKKQRYEEILAQLDEIENSGFTRFFDDMNLIKNKYPEELGFNAYWANAEAKKKAVEMGKDSAYYARAHYTKAEFDTAMEKFELVNRLFRNTPSYNHLNIIEGLDKIKKPVLVIQGEYDHAIGVGQAKMIYDALQNVPQDKKELQIIPDAAHNLNMEAPEQYFGTVRSFLARHN